MYSQYYGFAYILPIFVGLISDRYMAKTRSLLIGFISMIISQLILFASASLYAPSSVEQTAITFNLQNILFIVGLAFLALGTSFANNTFSNIISLVSNNTQEAELDSYPLAKEYGEAYIAVRDLYMQIDDILFGPYRKKTLSCNSK